MVCEAYPTVTFLRGSGFGCVAAWLFVLAFSGHIHGVSPATVLDLAKW